ncbi:MAG TPA: glycosyltransferase family 39 protein [Terracidiphilus sp.]|jgi:Dolichyl-phosphate-mannose-protein mannosyltransferase
MSQKRGLIAVWLVVIGVLAVFHALDLRADFPNHSPWAVDWAKYTDEGWYGNAAIRAHLFGSWYLRGDFNPAPAVPIWPFLEWLLFFFTGVSIQAARGLAVSLFFTSLLLSYLLLKRRGPQWMALLAVTLLVASPFLYSFSRLAILEPLLITLTLAALNLAVRLPGFRHPVLVSLVIGFLFTLMLLTKTSAVFLLPAMAWAIVLPLWRSRRMAMGAPQGGLGPRGRKLIVRCVLAAGVASLASFGLWMAFVVHSGMLPEYEYLFYVNRYIKPAEFYWPLISLGWALHGALWVDYILVPLAAVILLGAGCLAWRKGRARRLLLDPIFGASALAITGTIFFMTYQNHTQPRYFTVVAFFSFFMVAQGTHALLEDAHASFQPWFRARQAGPTRTRWPGWLALGLCAMATGINGAATLSYATHPEYTFVNAAQRLTRYIDEHPNGKRLLVCISGDEITLITHLPALNDMFDGPGPELPDLAAKLGYDQPGWYATWNQLDAGALEDLHSHYSVEQVASFRALDDKTRDLLVLFKLHPWPNGRVYDPADENLRIRFPEDKFDIPLR